MNVRCILTDGQSLDVEVDDIDAIPLMWLHGRPAIGREDNGTWIYDDMEQAFSGKYVVRCFELTSPQLTSEGDAAT